MYTVLKELRVEDDLCLDAWGKNPADVHLGKCHGGGGNQEWHHLEDGTIRHSRPTGSSCLESYAGDGGKKLKVNDCNGTPSQQWTWNTAPVTD
jgi:hypothetical protein